MKEFKSLNGYAVKDETARNIAKGRNQSVAFEDYATMINALKNLSNEDYKVGQNIYIGTVDVPDLWVYSIEPIVSSYIYTSDEEFINILSENKTIQIGYYNLAMLEGQKVDLTPYDEKLSAHDEKLSAHDEAVSSLNSELSELDELNSELETKLKDISKGANKVIIKRITGTISCTGNALLTLNTQYGTSGSVGYIFGLSAYNVSNAGHCAICAIQSQKHLRFYTSHLGSGAVNLVYEYFVLKCV